MSEANIQNQILAAIGSRPDCRLFRNHVGRVQDQYARWHTFGLCVGSADLIGWRAVTVTPEHVGQTLAVFLSVQWWAAWYPGAEPGGGGYIGDCGLRPPFLE